MKEWWTAREIADVKLPEMATTESSIIRLAKRDGWQHQTDCSGKTLARKRDGRGGGWEYDYRLFPTEAQRQIVKDNAAVLAAKEPSAQHKQESKNADLWAWYDRQKQSKKDKANARFVVLNHVTKLIRGGQTKIEAIEHTRLEHGCSTRAIYNWMKLVAGEPTHDWLPYLCPRNWKATPPAEFAPDAWEYFKADYLRLSKPSAATCYRRLEKAAEAQGWNIPSYDTVKRRVAEIPDEVRVLLRQGQEALHHKYPAQERDRSNMHAMEAVNVDGHKWDVWVKWPGIEKPVRPMMIAIQDLYSNKILSWRLDLSENVNAIRLTFKDMFEQFGIPEHCYLDNGRAFASKEMTGGAKTRFRYRIKEEDPMGILTQLGIQLHWTLPYSGQSKPIERAFRDLCDAVAKHPEFEGAYTGNCPDNQPENYGSRAVELDDFIRVVDDGIKQYNSQLKRRTKVCEGIRSFDEVFNASYAKALIRKAPPEQLIQCMLRAEQVSVNRKDGSVHLMGNRYWNEKISAHAGTKVTVRFDPDNLHDGIYCYRMDGALIGFVEVIEAVGFADAEAARQHTKARRDYVKKTKEAADLEKQLSLAELVRLTQNVSVDEPALPENKVTRLVVPKKRHQAQEAVVLIEESNNQEENYEITNEICRALTLIKNEHDNSIN